VEGGGGKVGWREGGGAKGGVERRVSRRETFQMVDSGHERVSCCSRPFYPYMGVQYYCVLVRRDYVCTSTYSQHALPAALHVLEMC
jgi:hypothetical protein